MEHIKDSVNVDEFLANFEPYIVEEEDEGGSITLRIGDRNSNVIFYVTVSNITKYGEFDLDVEDVENVELDEITPLMENEDIWSALKEFISDEVVFDETH